MSHITIRTAEGGDSFDRAAKYVQGLFNRRDKPKADEDQTRHWKRLVQLNTDCPNTLEFYIHFPERSTQKYLFQTKGRTVSSAGGDNSESSLQVFANSATDAPRQELNMDQTRALAVWRCDAIIIFSETQCRIKNDSGLAATTDFDPNVAHREILYVMEYASGDLRAPLAAVVGSLSAGDAIVAAEVPKFWTQYFTNLGFVALEFEKNKARRVDQVNLAYFVKKSSELSEAEQKNVHDGPSNPLLYPPGTSTTTSPPPMLRPVILPAAYGTNATEGQAGFDQDFVTITSLPPTMTKEEETQVKTIHGNMLAFAKTSVTVDNWQRMARVENILEPLNLFSGSKAADWYEEQLRSSSITHLAAMRAYAAEAMQDAKQIAFEKRIFESLGSAEEKMMSKKWQARHVSTDQDIKAFDASMFTPVMADLVRERMVELRNVVWVKEYQKLVQERGPLIPLVEKGDSGSRAALADVQTRIEQLNQRRATMELAYQAYVTSIGSSSGSLTMPVETKRKLVMYVNESRKAESDRRLFGGASMPSSSITTLPTPFFGALVVPQTSSASPLVLPTLPVVTEAKEGEDAIKARFGALQEEEKAKITKLTEDAQKQFAVAEKAQQAIRSLELELENRGVTAQIPDYQTCVNNASHCYHSAIAVASALATDPKSLSIAQLQSIVDSLQKNNQCLGAYLATFEIFKSKASDLFQTAQQQAVQVQLARMRTILAQAQTALNETKASTASKLTEGPQAETFRAVMLDMENKKRELDALYQSVLQAQMTVDPEVAKQRADDMQKQMEELVKQRLAFTSENADAVQLALLMQQLQSSQVDLEAANQEAKQSAALALYHQRRAQAALGRRNEILQQAQLQTNPLRTITASREALDEQTRAIVESKRATLQALLDDLQIAIEEQNSQRNMASLIDKINAFESEVQESAELAELFARARQAKSDARALLYAAGEMELDPTDVEPRTELGDEDEDTEALREALDALESAIDDDDIDNLPDLLLDVELAQEDLGADVLAAEFETRVATLKSRAETMIAKKTTRTKAKPRRKISKRRK